MTSINIKTFVKNNTKSVWIYTSLTEAIVNSIHWIEEYGNNSNWKIIINFWRWKQKTIDNLSEIENIIISDNWIGLNEKCFIAFDKIHTEHKIEKWWKWFWRLTFLKFFDEIKISSYFEEEKKYYNRNFNFVNEDNIIKDHILINNLSEKENNTSISFNIKKEYIGKLDKKLKTIARKLFEKLLIYFIDDNYICPTIILKDDDKKEIILNDYLNKFKEIELIKTESFFLDKKIWNENYREDFIIKIFKVFFTHSSSFINLVADKRVVKDEKIDKFIPEFSEWLSDEIKKDNNKSVNKDYVIKAYVLWKYLDKNVLHDREWFDFENDKQEIWAFKKEEIYEKSIEVIKNTFHNEYNTRKNKKIKKIKSYINEKAFWHKPYIESFDYTNFWYSLSNEEMEGELQILKFKLEQESTNKINLILKNKDLYHSEEEREELIKNISDNAKSDLIHYVVNRKLVLDYFKDLLRRNKDWNFSLEKELHNVIYPMWKDSSNINYEEHNLWLLDERLVFSHYIESDKKISKKNSKLKNKSNKEPDLLIFNNGIEIYRNWDNNFSNPITIFEFKRPKRTSYWEWDNPVIQVAKYLKEIREWKHEMPDWYEKIKVDDNTPAYWYIIADITDKIKDFAEQTSLTSSPDKEWYFWYLPSYKIYIEIISYNKLVKDAELRNSILFKKLWINWKNR